MREVRAIQGLNGETRKMLIRRRFVPIEFTISESGGHRGFETKLPANVSKVVGFYATVDTGRRTEAGDRYYLGVGRDSGLAGDADFITGLDTGTIEEARTDFSIYAESGEWVFYAQPERLDFSVYATNDGIGLSRVATIKVTDRATGKTEDYAVWRSRSPGPDNLDFVVEYSESGM